jgi:hypothetical protein
VASPELDLDLPAEGTLSFFYALDHLDVTPGIEQGAVRFHEQPASQLWPLQGPLGRQPTHACSVRPFDGWTLPSYLTLPPELEEIELDDDLGGAYEDLLLLLAGRPVDHEARMAGTEVHYPFTHLFGQEDKVQPWTRSLGHACEALCGRGPGSDGAGTDEELAARAADWRLLLQVSSEDERFQEGPGWRFLDFGRLYFMIREQDLAEARFDAALAVFEC